MLDLDDVSPDSYNVQGLHHAGRPWVSFWPKEPPSIIVEARFAESLHMRAPTSNSCISTPIENWTHIYMNLFTRNSPYYHFLKYLLFLLKHPVYIACSTK
jgi:hypothetical protein